MCKARRQLSTNLMLVGMAVVSLSSLAMGDPAPPIGWIKQFGTPTDDQCRGVAADGSGNVYVCGNTYGSLGTLPNAGSSDGFVRKYDASQNVCWTTREGTPQADLCYGISVDQVGLVFVVGDTWGNISGSSPAPAGTCDAFIEKYTPNGVCANVLTLGVQGDDYGRAVSARSGVVCMAGGYPGAGGVDGFVSCYNRETMYSPWMDVQHLRTDDYDCATA